MDTSISNVSINDSMAICSDVLYIKVANTCFGKVDTGISKVTIDDTMTINTSISEESMI